MPECIQPALISLAPGRQPDPEDPVLAMQHHFAIGGNEIADQGRQTDAEVHINAVGKILHGPPRDPAAFLKHRRATFAFGGNPRRGSGMAFPSSLLRWSPT